VPITADSADRFKALALDLRAGFSRYRDAMVFNPAPLATVGGERQQ
jgi:hypothetical protein